MINIFLQNYRLPTIQKDFVQEKNCNFKVSTSCCKRNHFYGSDVFQNGHFTCFVKLVLKTKVVFSKYLILIKGAAKYQADCE